MTNRWFAILFVVVCATSWGAEPTGAPPSGSVYFRFVNLLRLEDGLVTVKRGGDTLFAGQPAGVVMGYRELSPGPSRLSVFVGETPVGEVQLSGGGDPKFYTVFVSHHSGEIKAAAVSDQLAAKEKDSAMPTPSPTPPSKRFRAYFAGLKFPYEVEAPGIGKWKVEGDFQFVELPVEGNWPSQVVVRYTERDGDPAEIRFHLNYPDVLLLSAFVTQQGRVRPDIACYPDCVAPLLSGSNATESGE